MAFRLGGGGFRGMGGPLRVVGGARNHGVIVWASGTRRRFRAPADSDPPSQGFGLIFFHISSQRDATTKPRVAESKTRRTLGIRRHPIGKAQGFALFVPHILGRSFVPEGHGENSPAFQRWETGAFVPVSPVGTAESCEHFNRPYGTRRAAATVAQR